MINAHSLAAALAKQLNGAVPDGFTVTNREGIVVTSYRGYEGHSQSITSIINQVGTWPEQQRLEAAVISCLDGVQSYVVDVTGREWPVAFTGTGRVESDRDRDDLPLVEASVESDVLRFSYSDAPGEPLMEFEPIRLSDLRRK